jgi:hypothetical protein
MSNQQDDFLSAMGAACSTLIGRTFLYVLAWVLGIVAAHATALHEFVWPWQVMWEVFPLALVGLVWSWWAFLVSCGLIVFLAVFIVRDIYLGFALIPFLLVWFLSHIILRHF